MIFIESLISAFRKSFLSTLARWTATASLYTLKIGTLQYIFSIMKIELYNQWLSYS